MADDIEDDEGGKSNKLLLIGGIVMGLAVVAALAVGGTLYFLDRLPGSGGGQEEVVAEGPVSGLQPSSAVYYSFEKPFVSPFASEGSGKRQRFMQVRFAVKAEAPEAISVIEKRLPQVLNDVNQLLRRQDFATMQTMEGKVQLQMAATEAVQKVVQEESQNIDTVLITDFVMQ